MIRTVIVDDEPNIREGLKLIIDWQKLGYEIIGEASNGREALLLIELKKPQLVITDIKMPEMTGLELIKECKNISHDTAFIILSGHNEFDLAREALHLGAYKYLLKPLEEEELESSLIELRQTIEGGEKRKLSHKIVLKTDLQKLLGGTISTEEFKRSFYLTNEISYYYAYLDFHGNKDVVIDNVEELINSNIPEDVFTSVILEKDSWFGFLIHSSMLKPYRNQINRFAMQLISNAFNKYGFELSIYIGSKTHNLQELKISREDASASASHRYYRDKGAIIEHKNIKNIIFSYEYQDLPIIDSITKSVFHGEEDQLNDKIRELIDIFRDNYLSAKLIYIHLNKMLNSIISFVTELNGSVKEIIEEANFIVNKEDNIYISGLETKLLNLCKISINVLNRYKKKSNTAVELKDYIDNNFRENLSLKYVADILNVNSAYLGQIFKKQTGVSFNSYLHNLRLDEAKKLLVNSNLKIYEIANSVGYQDVNYFMKKFESAMGTTPNTYRKNYSNL